MQEIQADVFQSLLKRTNCMIKNKDDQEKEKKSLHNIYSNESTKNFHLFYFVKFPALKEEIQKAKELNNKLHEAKTFILDEISSMKASIHEESGLRWYSSVESIRRNIEFSERQLDTQYPQDNEPELESTKFDEKIQKLSYQCTHGSKNKADERRIFREFRKLQRRKEQPHMYDKTTKNDSKQYVQYHIQEGLNLLRDRLEREKNLEQKKTEIAKEVMSFEEKLAKINQKRAKVNKYILSSQKQLNGQVVSYDENMKLLCHAKELATKKDLVALEELCHEQVEEFMSLWNKDNLFRANYRRGTMETRNLALEIETWKPS